MKLDESFYTHLNVAIINAIETAIEAERAAGVDKHDPRTVLLALLEVASGVLDGDTPLRHVSKFECRDAVVDAIEQLEAMIKGSGPETLSLDRPGVEAQPDPAMSAELDRIFSQPRAPLDETRLAELREEVRIDINRGHISDAAKDLFVAVADPAHPEGELTGKMLLAQTFIWLLGIYMSEYGGTRDVSRDVVVDFLDAHVFPSDSKTPK
jgi:hypothetical protein